MSEPTFLPPVAPDHALLLDYMVDSVRTPIATGRVQSRSRMTNALRKFSLHWDDADPSTVRYLVGWFTAMLGGNTAFRYTLPDESLYWPEYPVPVTTSTAVSGALSLRTYYVAFAWSNANGETRIGPKKAVTVAANSVLTVTVPEFPRYATGAKIYVGTTESNLTLQTTVTDSRGTWQEPDSGLVAGTSPLEASDDSTLQENILMRFAEDSIGALHKVGRLGDIRFVFEEVAGQ